jgi:OOP family OmpA-OmpF porin
VHIRIATLAFALATLATAAPHPVDAQVRSRVQEAARKAQEAREKAAREKATADSLKVKAAADSAKAKAPADSAKAADAGGAVQADVAAGTSIQAKPDPKIWENYDFVPGNEVLFFTDFSDDKVGNFATRLQYRKGAVEVVERDGAKVLRATDRSEFLIPVGAKLPDRFTLEIDVIAPDANTHEMLTFEGGADENRGDGSASVVYMTARAWIAGGGQSYPASGVEIPESMQAALVGNVAHVRVLMDGPYFKMYVNERRLYNIPELAVRRDSVIRVMVNASESEPVYLTGLRVAESDTDVLYDALANKGRWATQGILFATGKADLRPESRPVLKEIAGTLKQHEDLKILIEGHTDNVGQAAANLALSDARAAAVKNALVTEFGIDGERITTQGFGDTKPATPNTTPEGRAQNRRVEIVKM